MRRLLPLLFSLLALGAGCAAPAGDGPAEPPARSESAAGSDRGADAPAAPEEDTRAAAPADPPAQAPPPAQPPTEPEAPSWWSEAPVRQGDQVSVCAQATASTLREARQQAIRAAYDRLEAELGEAPVNAAIGSDYAATQEGDQWRFRVRVTGSQVK